MDNNSLIQIIVIIVGLVVLWVILRFVLRLTAKIFACGCSAILVLGILLFILRALNGS
jgi:hypothetical protein